MIRDELIKEVESCQTVQDLYDFVQREADNPSAVWEEM